MFLKKQKKVFAFSHFFLTLKQLVKQIRAFILLSTSIVSH